MGADITRLLLVMLFTGPMNEMPPALKATGAIVGVGGTGVAVAVDGIGVAMAGVAVAPVVDCPTLLPAVAHPATNNIILRTMVDKTMP